MNLRDNGIITERHYVGKTLEEAKKANVIDQFSTNFKDAINDSDIVIIATPVGSFKEILFEIKPFLTSKIVISDVGSTKTNIALIVSQTLGDYSNYFIPAHPIAGKVLLRQYWL